MSNPFEVSIPDEFKMAVDYRVYGAKLNDSHKLGEIVKWIYRQARDSGHEPGTPQQMFWEVLVSHCDGDDLDKSTDTAVIELLGRLRDLEIGIEEIRDVTARF